MCLKERLHLKPLKREILNLNTFGTEQCQKKGCDLVKIILKGQDGSHIEVSALTFPTICAPPATAVQPPSCVELDGLELADQTDTEGTDSIDILIGSDHFWDIVTGKVVWASHYPQQVKMVIVWTNSAESTSCYMQFGIARSVFYPHARESR